mgnify:CR=1 FL=1|tara:strand:- start:261 stop:440 length:180 start_codon:yes stop_codon:yes gene_type:complete
MKYILLKICLVIGALFVGGVAFASDLSISSPANQKNLRPYKFTLEPVFGFIWKVDEAEG